jgi:hypothetical protein
MNRKPDPRSQVGTLNEIGGSIYHSVGQMPLAINTSDDQIAECESGNQIAAAENRTDHPIVECESGTRIAATENSIDEESLEYNSESGNQIAAA